MKSGWLMRVFPFLGLPALAGLVLLTSCSYLTGHQVSVPSPIVANPASLRIAVLAPEEFHLGKGDLLLTVYQNGGTNDISKKYTLVAAVPQTGVASIAEFRKPGQNLLVYRLSPADALVLRDQQGEMAAARQDGGAKPGFSVDLDKACWDGPIVAPGVPLDVLIEAGEESGFHPLLSDIDVFTLMNRPEASRLKSCSGR